MRLKKPYNPVVIGVAFCGFLVVAIMAMVLYIHYDHQQAYMKCLELSEKIATKEPRASLPYCRN